MDLNTTGVLIVLAPYLLLPVAGWVGGRGRVAYALALIPAALTGYFAWAMARVAADGAFTVSLPWASRLGLSLSFRFDGLGLLFALLVAGIGTLIVLYAVGYLGDHPLAGRFQLTLFAFMGSMLGVVLADNVILLFVFWELTGFTSYFLIAFDHEREAARRAAQQALLVTATGGLALLAAGVAMTQIGGTPSLAGLREAGVAFAAHPAYVALVLLTLLAAFTKSAQFPFHFWLPSAMEAPTPVSGYLHSATMVNAGVYLVARMTPLLGTTSLGATSLGATLPGATSPDAALLWTTLITAVGAVTMLGAAYRSLLETDLKRILAYTTVAALGAMMLLLGTGTEAAIVAGLVYLVAHACYKGALFLVAGAVDHETGTRDVRALGGLRRAMPITAAAGMLAAASMLGLPPLFGFIAKEQLYSALMEGSASALPAVVALVAAVLASAMMGAAALVAGVSPFIGASPAPTDGPSAATDALPTRRAALHEPPPSLWFGPLVLALVGLAFGVGAALTDGTLARAAGDVTSRTMDVHLTLWHGFTTTLLLSGVTLLLAVLFYRLRAPIRERAWPRALGTQRLYDGVLAAADGFSRRVGPALHSASLRAYVRAIVMTVGVLLVIAYVQSGGIPFLRERTPLRLHEVALALMIMLGAVSAARARTVMPAVLSLGTVGYGLALLYVLYGAPDLAATQFAVETLTVVLFVLVFYQLRGFYDRATLRSRGRDALIAGATGAVIGALVLVTSSTGVTSRLASYYIEAAPTVGHGRNIVNVILVDFRAFDTMGEITVLVTVAIGVRALLRAIRKRHP